MSILPSQSRASLYPFSNNSCLLNLFITPRQSSWPTKQPRTSSDPRSTSSPLVTSPQLLATRTPSQRRSLRSTVSQKTRPRSKSRRLSPKQPILTIQQRPTSLTDRPSRKSSSASQQETQRSHRAADLKITEGGQYCLPVQVLNTTDQP